jgi:hypothetical protein
MVSVLGPGCRTISGTTFNPIASENSPILGERLLYERGHA